MDCWSLQEELAKKAPWLESGAERHYWGDPPRTYSNRTLYDDYKDGIKSGQKVDIIERNARAAYVRWAYALTGDGNAQIIADMVPELLPKPKYKKIVNLISDYCNQRGFDIHAVLSLMERSRSSNWLDKTIIDVLKNNCGVSSYSRSDRALIALDVLSKMPIGPQWDAWNPSIDENELNNDLIYLIKSPSPNREEIFLAESLAVNETKWLAALTLVMMPYGVKCSDGSSAYLQNKSRKMLSDICWKDNDVHSALQLIEQLPRLHDGMEPATAFKGVIGEIQRIYESSMDLYSIPESI